MIHIKPHHQKVKDGTHMVIAFFTGTKALADDDKI